MKCLQGLQNKLCQQSPIPVKMTEIQTVFESSKCFIRLQILICLLSASIKFIGFSCGKYGSITILLVTFLFTGKTFAGEQAAPHFVVQPTVAGGLLTEGQLKILQCQAVGFPPPEYRWLKDGVPLSDFSPESFLRIPSVTKDDAGDYQCIARNSAGVVFSDKTTLTVAYMSIPSQMDNKTLTIPQGVSIILSPPEVDSVPLPAVSWQRKSQGRISGPKYAFTEDNRLVILSAHPSDSDEYQATLTNTQVGQEGRGGIIRLIVSENASLSTVPPEIIVPPKNSTFQQTSYPAVLECIANGRPIDDLETIWRKDNNELHLAGISYFFSPWNRSVTLLNVAPSHAGQYECEVRLRGSSYPPVSATAFVSVKTKPHITVAPKPETASELGQMILLPCETSGFPSPLISWYRNTEQIKANPGDRYSILSNGSLRIENLIFEDSGIFQCVAQNEAGETSASTWLHVKTTPPAFLKAPENATVLAGKDLQIPCEASGAPVPSVSWIFNDEKDIFSIGRIQILESGSLLISSVETKDVGKYTCIRTNSGGSITGSAYLTVLVRTQIIQPPVDTKAILSSTAELQCKVFHDPEVTYKVSWTFGDSVVNSKSNDRISILSDGSLRIAQARNTDVGVYTCHVTSAGGNETRSARLDVIELPHPPNNVHAVLLHTFPKTVNVSWTKAFDGNSPIINYVVQIRKVPSTGTQLEMLVPWVTAPANISGNQYYHVLTNLKPSSSYEFRVSAVNGVGEGNPSMPTEIITIPPEPPSGPPQGVVGGARSSTSIMIQWQPPAQEDLNGFLMGYMVRYKLAGYASSPWVYQNITSEAQHSCLLDDLIVWQKYEIQVAAYNERGVGVYSDSIYIRTREGVPQSAPSDVKARALSSTSVKVSWKPPDPQLINGINLGYKVQTWIGPPSDILDPVDTVLVPPSIEDPLGDHTVELTGLEKFTRYNVTVLCFTNPGDGPMSKPVEVITFEDVPDVIKSLKFEDVLYTSVRVLWMPPEHTNGILRGYTLKYHVKDVPETMVMKNVSNETTQAFVTGLQPVTAYTFEIFAWTSVGPGGSKVATIQSGIPPVLPGAPSKLAVSNIGAFSVVLQFTPGFNGNSSITKWVIEGQTRRNDTWSKLYEAVDPDASSVTVYNLVPFTEYRLRLLATNVVGTSPPSEPTKYFQTLQAPPSHSPYNVTVRAVNARALRVRWTPLQQTEWFGIPRGYNISYRPLLENISESFRSVVLEDYNTNSFVLENLEEFTEYEVYMQSYNDVGISSPSPVAKEKTRESVPSSGPMNVEAIATSSTTVVVNWGEVPKIDQNGIIEGYKVYFGAKSVPFQYKIIEGNTSSTTTLTELRKFTLYSVQVLAYTHIGDGALSIPPVSVKTHEDVPGTPSNISFPDVTTTTARIIWDVPEEPNGEILSYRVTYQEDGNEEVILSKDLPAEDRTFKAFNLTPLRLYLFTVTAKTNEGWGKVANAVVFTTNSREKPQPPSAPIISKSQIQSRQVTFSWTPGRNGFAPLRYYTVQLSQDDEPWRTLPVKVDPMLTTYTVTGLKPFTPYKFRIQATNDMGASDFSPASNLTQTLPAAPEDAPEDIVATPNTPTSVHVQWKPVRQEAWNGDIQNPGYRIEYCLMSFYVPSHRMDCPSKRASGTNASSVSLDNLEQDRIYEIRVYAYNRQGDGPPSRPVSIYVGEAVPSGEPQNIRVEAVASTELKVHWKPPLETQQNGDLLGYKVFYLVVDESKVHKEEMEAVPVALTEVVLTDLKKYTVYRIQVLAFNPAGDGPRSGPVHVRTKEDVPGPPGSLIFSDITMTSLTVHWKTPEEPNGLIRGYLVTYETALSEIDFSKQVRQKVTNTFLVVHGLRELVTYTFSIRAETFSYGPEVVSNVTTGPQKGSPDVPQDLSLRHTHTAVTLHWRNGGPGDAPIDGYIIEAQPSGAAEEEWHTLVHLNNGPQVSYTISFQNLLPSTVYAFRLFARNRHGISLPVLASEAFATPSKYYLEYRQKLPFYREVWFMVMLASLSVVIIIIVVAILWVKSKSYKYKQDTIKTMQDDHMSMDDGGFATFELRQSRRGTLCKNSLSRKSNSTIIAKSPPRPSPASVTYSDDEDVKAYDENCDSSSLTEKPSELSSTDSQGESDADSDIKSKPHSFVNHYANVNDTLRQSWKRQRPVVKPPSYTDSEPEGSVAVSLNGGHIIMNNMAGSRAPLPGFSSFV